MAVTSETMAWAFGMILFPHEHLLTDAVDDHERSRGKQINFSSMNMFDCIPVCFSVDDYSVPVGRAMVW